MKKPECPAPQLSDQDIARIWRKKRRVIYPCVFAALALGTVGLLLKDTAAGTPLLTAALLLGAGGKALSSACRRCPRCGHANPATRSILRGFTCVRCGFTISDTYPPVSTSWHKFYCRRKRIWTS